MNDASAVVANELRTAASRSEFNQTLYLWADILAGSTEFNFLIEVFRKLSQLRFLTVDTTSVCDLTCPGMCYYHPDIDVRRKLVSIERLKIAISDAHSTLGLRTLVFAGKEPLINARRLFELAEFASSLRPKELSIGIVTNGRLLARHWSRMDALVASGGLSFLDISLDSGNATEHDRIRGVNGTYALSIEALRRCIDRWSTVRVGISSVLRHDNAEGLIELIRNTSAFNRYFFFAPIQPPPFTATQPLAWQQVHTFLDALYSLLRTSPPAKPCEFTVALPGIYVWDGVRAGLFRWRDIREDANGQCFVTVNVAGHVIIFLLQVLTETGHAIARISADGSYLPNTHYLQSSEPHRYAVGNLSDATLPELYARAMGQNSLLYKLLRSRSDHACGGRSCWQSCFGGLANADTELVSGADISQQPRLCLKPRHALGSTEEETLCK